MEDGGMGKEQLVIEMAELRERLARLEAPELDQKLRVFHQNFHNLYDHARDGIVTLDLNGRILEANRAFQKMLGYAAEEISGLSNDDITPRRWHAMEAEVIENQVLKRGYSEIYEKEYMRSDGTVIPAELSTCLILGKNGEPVGMWAVVRDMSERKRMEIELRQTKDYLEKVIDNAVDAIGIVDRHGKFIIWNKRAEEIFGYRSEDVKGSHFVNVYADKQAMNKMLSILKRDGVIREYETTVLKKNGQRVPMELSINLLKNDSNETVGSVCVARDLTEKKLLEAQLLQAVKMEAVGTLSGGVAHDFNNLLQAIHGYAELLLFDRKQSDEGYMELQEILLAARRGGELTKQLLTFSRKLQSELRPVNLNQEVKKVASLLDRTIPKMIRVELRLQDDIMTVHADPNQMEQAILNLALNSRDAMPRGGVLIIETKNLKLDEDLRRFHPEMETGDYVVLSVTDTGCGMSEETRQHVFDPFFTTKEVGKGTGLGLSTVYGIAKSHRGHVECESKLDSGTTFRMFLPAVHSIETPFHVERVSEPGGGSETILIVDDENFVLDLGRQILTKHGYSVLTASTALEALSLYAREKDRIDLVVLDLIMPGMGGTECLAGLLQINPGAKVVLVSDYSTGSQSPPAVRETGAMAFLKKPYRSAEILDAVRSVLDEN